MSAPIPPFGLKLNIGCGFNQLDGYLNVDGFADCSPDLLWNLETTPWPFETDSVDEIYANHVLEHLGQQTDTFFAIVKEIYRVVRHGGEVRINVPHPLHNAFLTDPTHVRQFTAETFTMLSRERNLDWAARKVNVTMLALMLDVDFEQISIAHVYDKRWLKKLENREVTQEQVREAAKSQFNVVREIQAHLRINKSHLRQAGQAAPGA